MNDEYPHQTADWFADLLIRNGWVRCDIPACNCGSWHHRYGLPERWDEVKELLQDADVLNNDTGNLVQRALELVISQRDAARADRDRWKEAAEMLDGFYAAWKLGAGYELLRAHSDGIEARTLAETGGKT